MDNSVPLGDAHIKPLDLILFRGIDPGSKAVGLMNLTDPMGYSHGGIAVTREVLDLPFLDPGKLYVLESTEAYYDASGASSTIGAGGSDQGGNKLGVQVRDLEVLILGYVENGGRVEWSRYIGLRPQMSFMRRQLTELYEKNTPAKFDPRALTNFMRIAWPALCSNAERPRALTNFMRIARPALRSNAERLLGVVERPLPADWRIPQINDERGKTQEEGSADENQKLKREGKTNAPRVQPEKPLVYTTTICAVVYEEVAGLELNLPNDSPEPKSATPSHILGNVNLFATPIRIDSGNVDEELVETVRLDRRTRDAKARLQRHKCLQERLREHGDNHVESASITDDGRVSITFKGSTDEEKEAAEKCIKADVELRLRKDRAPLGIDGCPSPLNIAVLVCGTRGDVQPFIGIGQRLKRDGHRIRICTHACFRDFVESSGLEFYPLAGDPKALISYMVKTGGHIIPMNPGVLLKDAPKARAMTDDIIESCWGACTAKDPGGAEDAKPFTADAIISNPVVFAHYHVAEALEVPLHIIFTMPWTPTRSFPHAMACHDFRRKDCLDNYLTYGVVDYLYWAGFESLIARFRKETLGIEPVPPGKGPGLLNDNLVPFTYLWSPALVPTPKDWGYHVDVADFIFFEQKDEYEPPADLVAFLANGEPPLYVGFGSVAVQDPDGLTKTIFDALQAAGKRGVVSAGWGGIGSDEPTPDHVYLIGSCPHDWLFPQMSAVCCHGGAGTVATALRENKPVVVIPFFGDQPFWGAMLEKSNAGPEPIPIGKLTVDGLAKAFCQCDDPEMRRHVAEISASLRSRNGADLAVESFYRNLPTTARGSLIHLGYSPNERVRVMAGDTVVRKLENWNSSSIHYALAARISKPMEEVYSQSVDGTLAQNTGHVLSYGCLGDREASLSDFEGAGYTANEMEEVAALLDAKPDAPFNLSVAEMKQFQEVRQQHPDNGPEALQAANETLRDILHKRHAAYLEGGIGSIEPYVRKRGTQITEVRPGEELRDVIASDSIAMCDYPEIVRALINYPKDDGLHMQSCFFWKKVQFEGHASFCLVHNMHYLGIGVGIVTSRWFYISRGMDVCQITGGLMPMDDETLILFAHRVSGEKIAEFGNKASRDRHRRAIHQMTTDIVDVLRASDSNKTE